MTLTRRQALGTIGRAVAGGLAGLVTGSALAQECGKEPKPTKEELKEWVNSLPKPKYTYEQFINALGKNYDSLSDKAKEETKKYWHGARPESGNVLVSADKITEIYSDHEAYIKNLPEEKRKKFYVFVEAYKKVKKSGKKNLVLESIKLDCKKNYPWKINLKDPSLAEELLLYSINEKWRKVNKKRDKNK